MLFFWTLYSSKNPEKMYDSIHKNIKQHNCNNNYKYLLCIKSVYYYDFWLSCDS